MRIVARIVAMSRATQLNREFREIERASRSLPPALRQKLALLCMRELAQAGRCEFPHLYGTAPEKRYTMWGSGTDIGLSRARSDNPQVRLRGIALWLAVAFHETRDADYNQIAAVHRQVLGMLRQLKESVPRAEAAPTRWNASEAAA